MTQIWLETNLKQITNELQITKQLLQDLSAASRLGSNGWLNLRLDPNRIESWNKEVRFKIKVDRFRKELEKY